MNNLTKFYLLFGTTIMDIAYSATSPTIQIYFMKLINEDILAISNIVTAALAAIVNMSVQSDKLMLFYRRNFVYIIIIDIFCFILISIEGLQIPEIRFLGLAFLNAVSSTLWFTVISDAINHQIEGTLLTKWNSLQKAINLTACIIGASIAIFFKIDIEICILLQCFANLIFGFCDYFAYRIIKY